MTDMKVRDAGSVEGPGLDAEQLLAALSAIETEGESFGSKLGLFDQPEGNLAVKDLTHLREGLKRIASRIGVCTALIEKMLATPEPRGSAIESEGGAGMAGIVATAEDAQFPMDGCSDAITGLPTRAIGEKAIASAMTEGRPRYAAVFALDRICHMAGRYGTEVGSQAIRNFALFLTQKLPSDSLLSRWRGAAYFTLFDNAGTIADAKLLMEQIAIQKVKFNFMTNHRTAMVNLTASFSTFALSGYEAPDALIKQVDHFIETHSARQPH
jgi:GGDEF domain-containing protein